MTRVLIFSLVLSVCHALTEKTTASEFATTTEQLPAGLPAEERLAENIARARNSSQLIPVNESEDDEDAKQTDKKPRTVIHRDSGFNSRDKSILSSVFRETAILLFKRNNRGVIERDG